jgi:hypothetical protein
MDDFAPGKSSDVIRITRKETESEHVDNLLKRQMSLRGELGITRTYKRCWYYQNWFVFMLVGMLAAAAGWAIIEPYFNDYHYLQGKIEELNTDAVMPGRFIFGDMYLDISVPGHGYFVLNGRQIWVLDDAKELRKDGSRTVIDRSQLQLGQEIGAYVSFIEVAGEGVTFCHFIDTSPPSSSGGGSLSLSQLNAQSSAAGLLLFPLIAGLIGLAIGAVDGIVCRTIKRALLSGAIGLLVGFIGGFFSSIIAGLVYAPLNQLAVGQMEAGTFTPFGFFVQTTGRGLAWCLAGMAMGLGQGIALRSKRLLFYGFIGGVLGGLLGGLLFDPIDLLVLGTEKTSAHLSRLIGFVVIGASVGAMIGLVELLARDSWLQMVKGPLAGKEFIIFKDSMKIGSSPRNDIYLFNDIQVAPVHSRIQTSGDICEIENLSEQNPVLLNGHPVRRSRLHNGDQITIGQTIFVFQTRK